MAEKDPMLAALQGTTQHRNGGRKPPSPPKRRKKEIPQAPEVSPEPKKARADGRGGGKLTIEIDPELHLEFKIKALRQGSDMKQVLTEMIEEYVRN